MARCKYYQTTLSHNGLPVVIVPNAAVTVYEAGTTAPIAALLYAGPTGGATLPNPHFADADGAILFYLAAPQDIKVVASGVGVGTLTADYERVLPAAGDIPSAPGGIFPTLSVGDALAPAGNLVLVHETTTDNIGQTMSVETNVTAGTGGDYSALRVVMREMLAANNQSHGAEIHGIWSSGDGSQFRSALTVTAQGTMTGDSSVEQNAIRIITVPATWGMVGGQDMDNAILVQQGEADYNAYIRAYDKTGTLRLLAEKSGRLTAGTHLPLATSAYDLGSGTVRWRAGYLENLLVENGAPNAPTITFRSATNTGLFRPASGALGFAANGAEAARFEPGGLLDFRNGQQVAVGTGATATLGKVGAPGPGFAAQSVWLKYQFNGVTYAVPGWAI